MTCHCDVRAPLFSGWRLLFRVLKHGVIASRRHCDVCAPLFFQVGGFCVGSCAMVDHQRLSGSGYCFSASLPPFLAVTASKTLELFEASAGDTLASLQRSAQLLRAELASVPGLTLVGGYATLLVMLRHEYRVPKYI